MYKENLFLKTITYGPLVFIPLLIGIILLITIQTYTQSLEESLKITEENIFKIEKEMLRHKIENIADLIEYKKSIIKKDLKYRVRSRVEEAYKIANSLYEKYKDSKSPKEIKELIKTSLQPLVWNDSESFIWIVNFDGVFQLAPVYLKKLEGSSIMNLQDATGRYIIQEEIAITKEKGEGFLWDTFTKPNEETNEQYEQVAFVKAFGHYNWYFGSAEYLDTATKKTNKALLSTIKKIDMIDSHYVFIFNENGDILLNRSIPTLVGKNISEIDNQAFEDTINDISKLIKDKKSSSLTYKWKNIETNIMEEKYSYIQRVKNSDWIVGSGFYLSDIEAKLSQEKVDIYDIFYAKSKNIVYLAIFSIFFALLLSYYITKKLRKSFSGYEKNLKQKSDELSNLNETLELKVIQRTAELEKIKDDLEVLATTDALTGLHNRYSLMKLLSIEMSRAKRYKTPLSVIMYDIDFFKKVNDVHGHDVGDVILATLSSLVKNSLRETDIVGRYGGEEFLIILPNTALEDAKYFANRLKAEVGEHSFEHVSKLTISLGVVEMQNDEKIDGIFKRVDNLLYKSKENGRDQISY